MVLVGLSCLVAFDVSLNSKFHASLKFFFREGSKPFFIVFQGDGSLFGQFLSQGHGFFLQIGKGHHLAYQTVIQRFLGTDEIASQNQLGGFGPAKNIPHQGGADDAGKAHVNFRHGKFSVVGANANIRQ
ncbi:hypothetical protein SDC9_211167 [bioreactor metagenome]|uniref:Uncharacterized protein n=1 Tax=bioreactor metagenome TaxID=1076179 RepID=A0A645JI96_9ZZZZ